MGKYRKILKLNKHKIFLYVLWLVLLLSVSLYVYIYFGNNNHSTEDLNIGKTIPHHTKVNKIGNGCFIVTWETKEKTIGYIKYDTDKIAFNKTAQTQDGMILSNEHDIKVCGLSSDRSYYIVVMSNGVPYGLDGNPLEIKL